jgi:hypothetical protein
LEAAIIDVATADEIEPRRLTILGEYLNWIHGQNCSILVCGRCEMG